MEEERESLPTFDAPVEGNSSSFLVQFFGIDEITDSFENKNLLVSQIFKDKINEVDKIFNISCFFVLQDVKALVGYGEIVRSEALEVCKLRAKALHAMLTSITLICYRVQLVKSLTKLNLSGVSW